MNRMKKIAELEAQLQSELLGAMADGDLIVEHEADTNRIVLHGDRKKVKSYITHYYWGNDDPCKNRVYIMLPVDMAEGSPEAIKLQAMKDDNHLYRLNAEIERLTTELNQLKDGN